MWLLLVHLAAAEEPALLAPEPPADPGRAEAFADTLLREDDPYNALTFYRWSLFLGGPEDTLQFKMGLAYERGARWEAAAHTYKLVSGELGDRAAYRAALCAHRSDHADLAQFELAALAQSHTPWGERALYASALLSLEQHDLDDARAAFLAVPNTSPESERAQRMATEIDARLPHRSPGLAGTLSLVPGLGQIYAGHVGDGIVAALTNTALGVWSATLLVDGFERERVWEIGAGAVLGGVFSITYPSNIVGAYRGAQRFNEHAARKRSEEILGQAWDPSFEVHATEVALP